MWLYTGNVDEGVEVTVDEGVVVGVIVWVGVGVDGGVTDVVTLGTAVMVFSQVGVNVAERIVAVTDTVGAGADGVLVGETVIVGVSATNSIGKLESSMMGSGGPPGWQAVQSVVMALPRI